jgi:2,4-diaminopentanoate dehydrogenase
VCKHARSRKRCRCFGNEPGAGKRGGIVTPVTPRRVVQWATGATGTPALRGVIDTDGLDLVGVRVYDAAKVGLDAGELAGRPPTGVRATDRLEDVLDLAPDVVLFTAAVERHPDSCVTDVVTLLGSGVDVIATGSSFIDPGAFDPGLAVRLAEATRRGGSTFLGVGLFPGFWGEAMAPVLSRLSASCPRVTVRESLSYAEYPSTALLFDVMGYGHPQDSRTPTLSDPQRAGRAFASTLTLLAKALGLRIEVITPFRETATTDRDLLLPAGTVAAGTVAAMTLGARADCGAHELVVEHVTWVDPAAAPDWSRRQGYEIEFDGVPTMRCTLELGTAGEVHSEMGCVATAMHAVHAIPVVCDAPPGVLDLADVHFTGGLR